jgi:hypothetical protein
MPAIDPKFLKCAAYLYPSLDAGRKGERSGGTAFFVAFPVPGENGFVPYVVTNRHLIEGGCLFLRIALRDGSTFVDEVPRELWTVADDDDLAVACLGLPDNHDVIPLGVDLLIEEDCTFEGWPIFPGDDVLFYGRLIGHDGREKNKPVMRFGNISMLADADAPIDFGGHQQIAFLVECRSISGFSGAPAFVHLSQPRTLHPDTQPPSHVWIPGGTRFLGVNCGHLPFYGVGRARPSSDAPKIPGLFVESSSGVAVVIPAWRLAALLNQEHFVRQREELFQRPPAPAKVDAPSP